MEDRLVRGKAMHTHTNAQSKSVLSCAMTVMDKIEGWEEEDKWVGSRFAACLWIYTKAVLCDGQESTQEYLRRRLLSILESNNWVCDDALEDHRRKGVSDLSVSISENEVLAALSYEIAVPCVVQSRLLCAYTTQSKICRQWHKSHGSCRIPRIRQHGSCSYVHFTLWRIPHAKNQ